MEQYTQDTPGVIVQTLDTRQYDNKAPPCPAVPTTAGEELPLTAAAAAGHD